MASSRITPLEFMSQIERMVGREKADIYYHFMIIYFGRQIEASELIKLCKATLGTKVNVRLHNQLLLSILGSVHRPIPRAQLGNAGSSMSGEVATGCQTSDMKLLFESIPSSSISGKVATGRQTSDIPSISSSMSRKVATGCQTWCQTGCQTSDNKSPFESIPSSSMSGKVVTGRQTSDKMPLCESIPSSSSSMSRKVATGCQTSDKKSLCESVPSKVATGHQTSVKKSLRESILPNSSLMSGKVTTGCLTSDKKSLCESIPSSLCLMSGKVATGCQTSDRGKIPNLRQKKIRVRPSPLRPHGKSTAVSGEDPALKYYNRQSASEVQSLGSTSSSSKAAGSPNIFSNGPITTPFGFKMPRKGVCRSLSRRQTNADCCETCRNSEELPDTSSLMRSLKRKFKEGPSISADSANLLNKSLDVYLKRLIKPCIELPKSRSQQVVQEPMNQLQPVECIRPPSQLICASMQDFRNAMDMNPQLLGPGWPVLFEKIHIRAYED